MRQAQTLRRWGFESLWGYLPRVMELGYILRLERRFWGFESLRGDLVMGQKGDIDALPQTPVVQGQAEAAF